MKLAIIVVILVSIVGCSSLKHAKQLNHMKDNYPIDGFKFDSNELKTIRFTNTTNSEQTSDFREQYLIQAYYAYQDESIGLSPLDNDYSQWSVDILEKELALTKKYKVLFEEENLRTVCEDNRDGMLLYSSCGTFLDNLYKYKTAYVQDKIIQSLDAHKVRQKQDAIYEMARLKKLEQVEHPSETENVQSPQTIKNGVISFEHSNYKTKKLTFITDLRFTFPIDKPQGQLSEAYFITAQSDALKGVAKVYGKLLNKRGEKLDLGILQVQHSQTMSWIHFGYYLDKNTQDSPVFKHLKYSNVIKIELTEITGNALLLEDVLTFNSTNYKENIKKIGSFSLNSSDWKIASKQHYGVTIDGFMCIEDLPDSARNSTVQVGSYYLFDDCGNFRMLQAFPDKALYIDASESDGIPVIVNKQGLIKGQAFKAAGSLFQYNGLDYYKTVTGATKQALKITSHPVN